jgi:hypothetical protein
MQKLLLQKGTGCVYAWSESLAERNDMQPYEKPVVKLEAKADPEPQLEKQIEPEPASEAVETVVVSKMQSADDIKAMAKQVFAKKK